MYNKYKEIYELCSSELEKADKERFASQLERLKELEEKENPTPTEESYKNGFIDGFETTVKEMLEKYGLTEEKIEEKRKNKEEKEKIEKAIELFRKGLDSITEKYNNTKFNLMLGDLNGVELTGAIKELDEELRELNGQAKSLIKEMDEFRLSTQDASFSMEPKEVLNTIVEFKKRLKELKQNQIDKYNARVDATNKKISELRSMELTPELMDRLNALGSMSRCSMRVVTWTDFKYLDQIDYNKLVEINKELNEIEKLAGLTKKDEVDLETDMAWIENELVDLESKIKSDMTPEEVTINKSQIDNISTRITEYGAKLEDNKDKIAPEVYQEYQERLNGAIAELARLDSLNKSAAKKEGNLFDELKSALNEQEDKLDDIVVRAEASYGTVTQNVIDYYLQQVDKIEANLNSLKNEIEDAKKDDKLDDNQEEQLNKIVKEIEEKLKEARTKLRDPGMVITGPDKDVFDVLNGQIDGVEKAIDLLEQQIEILEKPIKDKETRKKIDAQFKTIEQEIKDIEKHLEENKDKDPEKYEATKERLDKQKDRLEKLGKKYRSKCPLMVRAVKEAKHWLKNHKKIVLIAAGLAALALAYHVIIPALIHGNLLIGYSTPALSGITNFINNILGAFSAAHKTSLGNWMVHGNFITPAYGTSSLLKGLALSGISSAALIAPLVIAIKKLQEKGKKVEQKVTLIDKFKKTKDDVVKTIKDKKDKIVDKVKNKEPKKKKEKKIKIKQADKMSLEEIAAILKDYRKSGMTLDEYCEENGLTEEQKQILTLVEAKSQENIQEANKGRKGR